MQHFTINNTEGFTPAQLEDANEAMDIWMDETRARLTPWDHDAAQLGEPPSDAQVLDHSGSVYKRECERALLRVEAA